MSYEPISESCRICSREAPHEMRITNQGIEVVCIDCRALLEFIPDAAESLKQLLDDAAYERFFDDLVSP